MDAPRLEIHSNALLHPCADLLQPIKNWSRKDFQNTRITDLSGVSNSIMDLYFRYASLYSKLWFQNHLEDIPMYILHAMYANVLVNARPAPPNGKSLAAPHADFVNLAIENGIEDCDPFIIAALLNMATYNFYLQNLQQQGVYISIGVKLSQILGLHRDADLRWRSSASGRILGDEIGMDRQFLRSLWLMLYVWDHHDVLVLQKPMFIDTPIYDYVVDTYVPPNIGDPSNIPLK